MISTYQFLEFQIEHYTEMLEEAKADKSEKGIKRKWYLYNELKRLLGRKQEILN